MLFNLHCPIKTPKTNKYWFARIEVLVCWLGIWNSLNASKGWPVVLSETVLMQSKPDLFQSKSISELLQRFVFHYLETEGLWTS